MAGVFPKIKSLDDSVVWCPEHSKSSVNVVTCHRYKKFIVRVKGETEKLCIREVAL